VADICQRVIFIVEGQMNIHLDITIRMLSFRLNRF
jgi:hypothetical protein